MSLNPLESGIRGGEQPFRERHPDLPRLKEIASESGLVIAIAGGVATGSSTLAHLLEREVGSSAVTLKTRGAGEKFRRESGAPLIFGKPQEPADARKFDRKTTRSVSRTRPGHIKIVEARLAPWLAIRARDKSKKEGRPFPKVVTALTYANYEDQVQRAVDRDSRLYPNIAITPETMRQAVEHRERTDQESFMNAHKDLGTINTIDPNDPWSQENYDVMINTSEVSPQEGANIVVGEVLRKFTGEAI